VETLFQSDDHSSKVEKMLTQTSHNFERIYDIGRIILKRSTQDFIKNPASLLAFILIGIPMSAAQIQTYVSPVPPMMPLPLKVELQGSAISIDQRFNIVVSGLGADDPTIPGTRNEQAIGRGGHPQEAAHQMAVRPPSAAMTAPVT